MRYRMLMVLLSLSLYVGCGEENISVTVMTPTIQCGMCQKTIEMGLGKLEGVGRSTVDLATKTTQVSFNSEKTDLAKIERAISDLGYQANETSANSDAYEALPACCKIGGMEKM
ncbi:MAG: heavy metal-associated domain-containing protein [Candidatus Marinimicrobia bacterium]|nr:heavy metal-associated domain-containing protein [Candidatus Neomarinimicrobiota bacterium]